MSPRPALSSLLSVLIAAGPAAAQIKTVPDVVVPVGGGVSGVGGTQATTPLPTLAPLASPTLPGASVLPAAAPQAAVTQAAGARAAAAVPAAVAPVAPAAAAAVALPAAAVPRAAPRPVAASAAPGAAPTKGLEGVTRQTAEMRDLLGQKDGGAAAGVSANGIAASIFDGGVRRAGAVNGVAEQGRAPDAAPALADYFAEGDFRRLHPKEGGVYHDWNHSLKVARMAYDFARARGLSPAASKFLFEVGLLHDLDPQRAPGSPARVPATLEALRKDFARETSLSGQPGISLLRARFGWDERKLAVAEAIIQRTEFPFGDSHPSPAYKDASPLARYEGMLRAMSPGEQTFALREGALLSEYADKSSWYATEDFAGAARVVDGLANEINTASGGKAQMTLGKLDTAAFLGVIGEPASFTLDAALAARLGLDAPSFPNRAQAWSLLGGSYGARFDANLAGFAAVKQALADGRTQAEALELGREVAEARFAALAPAAPRAPPAAQPLAALGRLNDGLAAQAARAQAAEDPAYYKDALALLTQQLRAWQASSRAPKVKTGDSVEKLVKLQTVYKDDLRRAARAYLASRTDGVRALSERDVAWTGTTFEGLLGILFTGGLEATNRHQGFKGESAEHWGTASLDVAVGYAAVGGTNRNMPGVLLIIHNAADPIRVVGGETLSRQPLAGKDIIAAVVTDGVDTVLLQGPALEALASSSAAWKEYVKAEARRGRMAPFDAWERVSDRFLPR